LCTPRPKPQRHKQIYQKLLTQTRTKCLRTSDARSAKNRKDDTIRCRHSGLRRPRIPSLKSTMSNSEARRRGQNPQPVPETEQVRSIFVCPAHVRLRTTSGANTIAITLILRNATNSEADKSRSLLEKPSAPLSTRAVSEGVYRTSLSPCPHKKLIKLQLVHRRGAALPDCPIGASRLARNSLENINS